MAEGVEGLTRDKTRKPGKKPLPAARVQNVVGLALGPPPGDATHWTGRMLAKAAGVSLRSVQRILEAHQLTPRSVVDLQLTINRFVADINADPKPFVWTADPQRVLAAVKRGKQTLESIH